MVYILQTWLQHCACVLLAWDKSCNNSFTGMLMRCISRDCLLHRWSQRSRSCMTTSVSVALSCPSTVTTRSCSCKTMCTSVWLRASEVVSLSLGVHSCFCDCNIPTDRTCMSHPKATVFMADQQGRVRYTVWSASHNAHVQEAASSSVTC